MIIYSSGVNAIFRTADNFILTIMIVNEDHNVCNYAFCLIRLCLHDTFIE